MEALKSLGSVLLGLAAMIALWIVVILVIHGTAYVTELVFPYLILATSYVAPICGIILLPLTAFKRTRNFAVIGIYIGSFVFGALLWAFGFLVTYMYWGVLGIIVGLFIAGVGVVPVGILAAAFHGAWSLVFNLVLGAVIVLGARFWAMRKAEKFDEEDARDAQRQLYPELR